MSGTNHGIMKLFETAVVLYCRHGLYGITLGMASERAMSQKVYGATTDIHVSNLGLDCICFYCNGADLA